MYKGYVSGTYVAIKVLTKVSYVHSYNKLIIIAMGNLLRHRAIAFAKFTGEDPAPEGIQMKIKSMLLHDCHFVYRHYLNTCATGTDTGTLWS